MISRENKANHSSHSSTDSEKNMPHEKKSKKELILDEFQKGNMAPETVITLETLIAFISRKLGASFLKVQDKQNLAEAFDRIDTSRKKQISVYYWVY